MPNVTFTLLLGSFKTAQYFGVKTFPARDMSVVTNRKKFAKLFDILKRPYS